MNLLFFFFISYEMFIVIDVVKRCTERNLMFVNKIWSSCYVNNKKNVRFTYSADEVMNLGKDVQF
jgi:hypothetical protein